MISPLNGATLQLSEQSILSAALQNLAVRAPRYDEVTPGYNKGSIPTPQEAGLLLENGAANFSNPYWLSQIELAASRNGGLGNAEDGYLAWGREGFFRFKNDTLPSELSARYARISLLSGLQIEDLKISNEYTEKHFAGKEEFASKFESSLQAFIEDPKVGFKVDGGGVIYTLAKSKEGEGFTFVKHKKKGFFGKFFEKISKWVSPVLSFIGNFFPPLKVVSMGLSAINGLVQRDYAKDITKEISRQGGSISP